MSVWLPKPSPALLARAASRQNQQVTLRVLAVVSRGTQLPLTPLASSALSRRYESTRPSSNNVRNASSSATEPTSEPKPTPPTPKEPTEEAPLATRVWKKVKHEAQHYWHGSKLLGAEVRISSRLVWKILHGEALTRRERRQVRKPDAARLRTRLTF